MSRPPILYGLVVFACVFFVGWITGMGGSLLPNLGFSALMGVFAGAMFGLMSRRSGRGE